MPERSPHVPANPEAWRHSTTPPDDRRPYRAPWETGPEMRTHTLDGEQRWRQIGWHGQTGAFYALGEKPSGHEPGGWAALWLLVDNDRPEPADETEEPQR